MQYNPFCIKQFYTVLAELVTFQSIIIFKPDHCGYKQEIKMTIQLDAQAERVAKHYTDHVFSYEKIRLEQDSPVEFALTKKALDRWVKEDSIVLDVGVGVGHYDEYLAKRGCKLHLVDICEQFLLEVQRKLTQQGLLDHVLSAHRASATNLKVIPDQSIDVVLMLGPFYHLLEKQQREQAVAEAYRVLKSGGVLFAAGINRLAVFHELFKTERFFGTEIRVAPLQQALAHFCETGVVQNNLFPPLGDAYCATVDEFKNLFQTHFQPLEFLGIESFAAFKQKKLFEKTPEEQEAWLALLEKTASMQEGLASTEHFLFVGKKC